MRLTVCCQDGQGGQCQALHQPAAGGASRGGRDPCHPGGRVTDVQGPGQDGQVSRGPQAAQGGAGRHGHQGELSLIIWWCQVQEIMELKKALAKTRQDLQKTRSRRQSQDNRSSSDEVSSPGPLMSLIDWWYFTFSGQCVLFVPSFFYVIQTMFEQCLAHDAAWLLSIEFEWAPAPENLQPIDSLPGSASGYSRLCEHCLHKDNAAARNPGSCQGVQIDL